MKIYGYLIRGLLAWAAVITAFALSVRPVSAQNVMHLRIDTITAKPGAVVDVRVLYTFTSTHAHNIHDFLARFLFDTSESQLDTSGDVSPFIMDGAAPSPEFNISYWSLAGFLALGDTEINLTDTVLFSIRMTLDSNADTAWIRWDPKWTLNASQMFQYGDEGIDSAYWQDGWIRSSKPKASVQSVSPKSETLRIYPNPARDHVMIEAPGSSDDEWIDVYDMAGRLSFEGSLILGGWQIPSTFQAGAYEVVINDVASRGSEYIGTLLVAPR